MAKSIIHLEDLEPKFFSNGRYENCYIKLGSKLNRELFNRAIDMSPKRTLKSLAEVLNEKLHLLSDARNRALIRLSILKKLSNFLVSDGYKCFSLENLEKCIEYIKGASRGIKIHKPKFPLNFAIPAGIRIISRMYHDGGIGKGREPYYHNQNVELIEEFCRDVRSILGEMKLIIQKNQRRLIVELPHIIGDILELTGCFLGTKVDNNPSPPSWIEDLDQDLIKEFVRVAMDDEGSVGTRGITLVMSCDITIHLPAKIQNKLLRLSENERTNFIRKYFKLHKNIANKCISKILLLNQRLLDKLKIKTTGPHLRICYTDKKREHLRATWNIQISSKENMEKFQKLIGFRSKHKNEKLEFYIKNIRTPAKKNENIINFLIMVSEVEKERGFSTDWLVASKFNYHHQYLGRIRLWCENKNLIKRIGTEGRKIKFVLTKDAKQMLSMAH